jgi:hypothetical protein
MTACAHCKTQDTQLYVSGVPICLNCSERREAKPVEFKSPQTEQEIRGSLLHDILSNTSKMNEAKQEFEATLDRQSGLPHSDGSQRIKNASTRLSVAREGMMAAHDRLSDYLDQQDRAAGF